MLISEYAEIAWNPRNKRRLVDLGYSFTKMRDPINVKVEDLSSGSNATVTVKCDYCGNVYTIKWNTRVMIMNKCVANAHKDCCVDCCETKAQEAIISKYGSNSNRFLASNSKRKATNMERYGAENVFASKEIQKKIKDSMLDKYGVPYGMQCREILDKAKQTSLDRYGVEYYVELFKGKYIKDNSPVWKGGVTYSRVERSCFEYNEWRKSVFARDNYTCMCCGKRSHSGDLLTLNAHHVKNWADNPHSRFDVDNGITLCNECHTRFHSEYGKHNNTEEQLHEFIQTKRYAELAGIELQDPRDKKLVG